MKNVLTTNGNNWSALVARLALGLVVFPHGAQKLLGWFGGYGFEGTMGFLTTQAGLPAVIALLVILIESVAALFVFFGFFTRVAALGIFGLFTGIVFKMQAANGFFMNWAGNQKGEGMEYFFLLLGLSVVLIIAGGGKASVDAYLTRERAGVRA
ncbi:MAG: DoxX family protein [Flavisolibacter sp.]